jgi:ATP-dependent DNA ligase
LKLRSTILDGEIVALDEEGIPRFQLLQKWQKRPTAPVVYVLFDLLWDSGRDLAGKSVIQRRERLQEIITPISGIQVGGYLENRGVELFRLAKEKGLEGIKAPVWNPPKIPERIQWVQPKLVCEVAFAEWTQDGELRQTAFLGWRDDKSSEQVVLE